MCKKSSVIIDWIDVGTKHCPFNLLFIHPGGEAPYVAPIGVMLGLYPFEVRC